MPAFIEMDPELIRKALEGHTDVLAGELKKEEAFFRNTTCPICGGTDHSTYVNAKIPFTEGRLLPNKLLKCLKCQTEFDPYSRIIHSTTVEPD